MERIKNLIIWVLTLATAFTSGIIACATLVAWLFVEAKKEVKKKPEHVSYMDRFREYRES